MMPLAFMGFFFVTGIPRAKNVWPIVPFLLITFMVPAASIIAAAIGTARACVAMEPDVLTIVDGWGRVQLETPWRDVTGVYLNSTGSQSGRYRTCVVESHHGRGSIRSTLADFENCIAELRERVPPNAVFNA